MWRAVVCAVVVAISGACDADAQTVTNTLKTGARIWGWCGIRLRMGEFPIF